LTGRGWLSAARRLCSGCCRAARVAVVSGSTVLDARQGSSTCFLLFLFVRRLLEAEAGLPAGRLAGSLESPSASRGSSISGCSGRLSFLEPTSSSLLPSLPAKRFFGSLRRFLR